MMQPLLVKPVEAKIIVNTLVIKVAKFVSFGYVRVILSRSCSFCLILN